MTDATTTPTDKAGSEFSQYRRSQIAELRPYVPGEPAELLYRVSISQADLDGGSPKDGDMIARNPANHDDQWLVAADYFAANFEPLTTPQPLAIGLDREAVARVIAETFTNTCGRWCERESSEADHQHDCLSVADKILALAAPADGYVLVPVEPTEAMIEAGRDAAQSASAHSAFWADEAKSIWSAMIAACLPAGPVAPADGWRGIETHDGSSDHVLIAEGDGSVCEARLLDDGRGWWERNNDPTDAWGYECNPTHWMPLPAAPTGETGA